MIDLIARKSTDVSEISLSSKEMTHVKTPIGRVRAWLRLALMQKRLADYFKLLVEQKQELRELYDNEALLISDEMTIISGLLVGLNVLDFNFCLKETALDYPMEPAIHYSLYLRERRIPSHSFSLASTANAHPPGAIQEPADELDDYSSISSSSPPPTAQNDDTVVITNTNDVISLDENNSEVGNSVDQHRMASIIDQKNYVEELYRHLQ